MTIEFPPDAIGITSTIPIEVPLAAGRKVVDLNNIFILARDSRDYVKKAESDGFPRNCCTWIKGIYGLVRSRKIRRIIFVTGGDCSNTHAMMETLLPDLDECCTFSYPYPADEKNLAAEVGRFCEFFGTKPSDAENMGKKLSVIRKDLERLDEISWRENTVTGLENHLWLVSASDFEGDPERYHKKLKNFIREVGQRTSRKPGPRLGIVGVPPIQSDLHQVIEDLGANIVFNEIPRQFAMTGPEESLSGRYSAYTYPYGVWTRVQDIKGQAKLRKLHGIIHYTQSFCHRQIHDIVIRREVGLPTLTIEGENPGPTDQRTKLRIEGFIEILKERSHNVRYE